MRKNYILILLFSIIATVGFGQTRKAYLKAAEKAFVSNSYYEALTFYNEALDFDNGNPEVLYKSAEAARLFNAFETSEERFSKLLDTLENKDYPDAYARLAEVRIKQGKYEEAIDNLNYYLDEYAALDPELTTLARRQLSDAEWALDRINEPDKSAELSLLDFNTIYSDFSPVPFKGELFYTTMNHEEEDSDQVIARSISKIHKYIDGEDQILEGELNADNSLYANPTFSSDGKYMYYTVCEYGLNDEITCHLYESSVDADGMIGTRNKLGDQINVPGSTSTHPHIGYDRDKDREVLYFVSNKEGGQGGYDIYYSVFNSNRQLSVPTNLKEINTAFDEITPSYNLIENRLYFSTNGRKTLGGYDIYSIEMDHLQDEPVHIASPINSGYDDIYFVWNEDMTKSYVASNRATSARIDDVNGACCFDIYDVVYDDVVIDLYATTFDSLTRRALNGATLYLVNKATGDTIHMIENVEGNDFNFVLKRDEDYTIIASREHYDDLYVDISTHGISESTEIRKELFLYTPKTQLDLFTFNNKTKEELAGTRVVVRDLTDGSVVIYDLSNPTNNDYHLYLENGHRYDIEVSKFGFVTKHEIVDLTNVSEPTLMTRDVYLDVFEIEEYKDTNVYFENDFPNPKSRSTDTDVIYGDHYRAYILNKQDYIRKINKSRSITDKATATQEIDSFFEGDVAGGYDMFKQFMRALLKELELGRNLQVELKGYASPVADSKYNKSLSQRRVNCVKNEMLQYQNGIFRKYLGSRQLIIKDVSFGDDLAPSDVSDDPRDVIHSVYAVKAAKERRVEIIRIKDQ